MPLHIFCMKSRNELFLKKKSVWYGPRGTYNKLFLENSHTSMLSIEKQIAWVFKKEKQRKKML